MLGVGFGQVRGLAGVAVFAAVVPDLGTANGKLLELFFSHVALHEK